MPTLQMEGFKWDVPTVTSFAIVFATVVGPLLGVWLANIFSKRQSKRQAAAVLFSQIMQHSYDFSLTASRYHVAVAVNPKVLGLVAQASAGGDQNFKRIAADAMLAQQQSISDSHRQIGTCASLLGADVLSLELLFEQSAKKCVEKIHSLISKSTTLCYSQPDAAFDESALLAIGHDVEAIQAELKVLSKLV